MFNKKFVKKFIVFIAVLMCFSVISPSVLAADKVEKEEKKAAIEMMQSFGYSEKEAEYEYEQLELSYDFFQYNKETGIVTFDGAGALANGTDSEFVAKTEADMKMLSENNSGEVSIMAKNCKGKSVAEPANYRFYLDHCQTDDIALTLFLGATVATIIGILGGIFVTLVYGALWLIAAALMGAGSYYLNYLDDGCGIYGYWDGPNKGRLYTQSCS